MIKEKNGYTYIHIVFITFVLIFKFIYIYLLHVLFVLKIKCIFEKKNPTQKMLNEVVFFIYSIDDLFDTYVKTFINQNYFLVCAK